MMRASVGGRCAQDMRPGQTSFLVAASLLVWMLFSTGCGPGIPAADRHDPNPDLTLQESQAGNSLVVERGEHSATPNVSGPTTRSNAADGNISRTGQSSYELTILFWNVESGGADPQVIARQLAEMPRYDIYAFSEVNPGEFSTIVGALGIEYFSNLGNTGNQDRLAIAFRNDRLEFRDWYEIEQYQQWVINPGNHRSPLVYELHDLRSNQDFSVMVNHLARGNAQVRETQAAGLREWARAQVKPVLAVGDFNFDYDFHTAQGNPAMTLFLQDEIWTWVRPEPLIDSNWADRNGDGIDDYPDSLLDLAFVSKLAQGWPTKCEIIVRPNDFPDDRTTSDHRPGLLRIDLPSREEKGSGAKWGD